MLRNTRRSLVTAGAVWSLVGVMALFGTMVTEIVVPRFVVNRGVGRGFRLEVFLVIRIHHVFPSRLLVSNFVNRELELPKVASGVLERPTSRPSGRWSRLSAYSVVEPEG